MKSLTIIVLSYASLTFAAPYRRKDDYNWFWDKDFKDNTSHDNDESREFFRHTTKKHNEATTTDPDIDTTEDTSATPDYDITEDTSVTPDYDTTEDTSVTPDYKYTRDTPSWPTETTESETTDVYTTESDDSSDETFPTTEITEKTTPETTTESRVKVYYQKRKKQAQNCKENDHIKTQLHEFGNSDCQLCTCNSGGILLCTRISCSDNGLDTKKQHEAMLHNAKNTNLILREYATDCSPGTIVDAGQCSCSCVLPSVMSCPKNCFVTDDEVSHDSKTTEDSEATVEIVTDDYETKVKTTTEDYESSVEINTKKYETKSKTTPKDDEAKSEITTEDDEANVKSTSEDYDAKVDINTTDNAITTKDYEANVKITTNDMIVSKAKIIVQDVKTISGTSKYDLSMEID